jgi:hypothetical protein
MELAEIDRLATYSALLSLVPGSDFFASRRSLEGVTSMKLSIRIFAFAAIIAGAAAVSFSSPRTNLTVSHLSATSGLPGPGCGPGMGCPADGK